MSVKVFFFGKLKDVAGGSERNVDLRGFPIPVSALIDIIAGDDTLLADALRSPHVKIIVDQAIIRCDDEIQRADEIAFLPPVSGG